MLGLITALPIEGKLICPNIGYQQSMQINNSLIAHVSGIGEQNAKAAAEKLLTAGAKALISFGTAGGIKPQLKSGTLLLPKVVFQPDSKNVTITPQLYQLFSDRLHKYFVNDPININTESLIHSKQMVFDRCAKLKLYQSTPAIATDMESYAIGKVATQARVPFMVIRAIADPAEMSLPSFINDIFHSNGEIKYAKLISTLVTNYWELPNVIRMQRHFAHAKFTLAKVAKFLLANNFQIKADSQLYFLD